MVNIEPITFFNDLVKIIFIAICTRYTYLKIENKKIKNAKREIFFVFGIMIIGFISTIIKLDFNYFISRLSLLILMSLLCMIEDKENIEKVILLNIISLSVNYILFFIAIWISYVINKIKVIQSDSINLIIMIMIHSTLLYNLSKLRRIKNGLSYLNDKSNNEFLNLIIFNISIIILFSFIFFSSMDIKKQLATNLSITFIIFSIIMFLTIKKSIEAYYKQKLLIQDLNETRKELEDKKKEIEELEMENLNFSKKSHSLAHKQKSLEFKINKLLMNSENAEELGLQEDLKKIWQQLNENSKLPKLDKTGITEVDDMLNVMQEECRVNGIDFILQLKGNIYQMTNNYISKDDLAILLADHIKDAIIAINHSNNINKSIMVRLGKIEDSFSVYIYDSGIEFPKEVLEKLGKLPITTYPDEGGTGMGFMNTFDLLKKSNASLIIENIGKPSKGNYTKVIKIKFDNKNQIYV